MFKITKEYKEGPPGGGGQYETRSFINYVSDKEIRMHPRKKYFKSYLTA